MDAKTAATDVVNVLRRRYPSASAAQGLAFGTAFFLAVDEGLNTAAGFTPPPQAFPWQAHARGFAAHLAYGLAAETTLDVLDVLMPGGGNGVRAHNA